MDKKQTTKKKRKGSFIWFDNCLRIIYVRSYHNLGPHFIATLKHSGKNTHRLSLITILKVSFKFRILTKLSFFTLKKIFKREEEKKSRSREHPSSDFLLTKNAHQVSCGWGTVGYRLRLISNSSYSKLSQHGYLIHGNILTVRFCSSWRVGPGHSQ